MNRFFFFCFAQKLNYAPLFSSPPMRTQCIWVFPMTCQMNKLVNICFAPNEANTNPITFVSLRRMCWIEKRSRTPLKWLYIFISRSAPSVYFLKLRLFHFIESVFVFILSNTCFPDCCMCFCSSAILFAFRSRNKNAIFVRVNELKSIHTWTSYTRCIICVTCSLALMHAQTHIHEYKCRLSLLAIKIVCV